MKLEMNNLEALEQLNETQKAQQMEMEPPKLDRTVGSFVDAPSLKDCLEYSQIYTEGLEIKEKLEEARQAEQNAELPPKLDKDAKLGGTVMEMQLEMRELEYKQLKEQMFGEGGKLGESRDAFNKRRALESAEGSIAIKNRAKEYKEQLEEDERKKQEYRDRLYGDD